MAKKTTKMEGLTVSRIVHYVEVDGVHLPAIVVGVDEELAEQGRVTLQVFSDVKDGSILHEGIDYSEEPTPGTWHWTEKA
jgi:hypothetical protein